MMPFAKKIMSLLEDKNVSSLLKGDFENSVLKSAYSRIHDYNDPLRGPVFALLMRELIRITMDRLAPDELVMKSSWCKGDPWLYKHAQSGSDKVTRKGRYRFAITGTISDAKIAQYPQLNCAQAIDDLGGLISKLSAYAHISPGTYNLSPEGSLKFLREVETIVSDYAASFVAIKGKIAKIMLELVDAKLNEHLREAIPHELDELSSGTRVDAIQIEELEDFDTSSAFPVLSGAGNAEIELNYGGGSDGYTSEDSHPFTFHVQIDPDTFDVDVQSIEVDTSAFHDE